MAMFVKDKNARDYAEQFPEAYDAIAHKHYEDDYFDSTNTVEKAVQRASEVRFVHSKGGFEIRGWVSNSLEFLERMGETEKKQAIHLDSANPERVLGIVWNTKDDVFAFTTKMRDSLMPYLSDGKVPTKRVVLSCVMSLFDPLGLLAPFTFFAKVLIQILWRKGCEWDQVIDGEALEGWKRWTSYLGAVEAVKIPRYYFGDGLALDYSTLQLHIFADASEKAYGCVGYFRILAGEVPRCALVQAKSKVAPIKQVSIPRLELMAAVQGVRFAENIKDNHSLNIEQVFYWTDSRTVHSWVVSDQRKYKAFVAFRIGEIISRSRPSEWRWVPTKLNVTDQLTKWSNGPQLDSNSSWLRGPQFLYKPEAEWPLQQFKKPNVEDEMRATFLLHDVEVQGQLVDISRFSKRNMLVRTLAQVEAYPDEVRTLLKSRQAKCSTGVSLEKSSLLYKLSPILDEFDVIRMEGRLATADFLPFELRYPIVLPRGHQITRKLLDHYHQKFGHAGRETVTNEVRQRFCIPHLRAKIKKVMDSCMWCKIKKCKPDTPRMAPLLTQRITPNRRPFSFSGVDFFGPLEVTVGRHVEKRWVALFTCLVTRAIHLEVAHSLSSQSCLMAIRRFACRRGMPAEFFSDNATNFVAASKEVMRNIVMSFSEAFTDARTKWNFIPTAAPHMGGAWERMVRSAKGALAALDDGRKLTNEVLLTVLAEAEDAINSRLLTYMPQAPDTVEALSPNHFLRGYPSGGTESYVIPANKAEALRDGYKRSQWLADKLWQRWLLEYLPLVNKRTKW
ncbi:uncharacterized protein LOC129720529 [Wyeomyia smithii]|uniref:uncharacterized protein LOC129720529 n=1 Tax=Wyeomyia smithii TaxID=174621 RepID=UPI002467D433|nr:uncharacterized protein LOC129720529 [Wyeomyia smithii]